LKDKNLAQRICRAKAKANGCCINCLKPNDRASRTLCSVCQEKKRLYLKRQMDGVRATVFLAYGNKCACCAEWRHLFLGIDHVSPNSKEKGGWHLYRRLIKANFPEGYRLLCHNCNLGRYMNGGTCPHGNGI
jgi:hypothetical protein